MHEMNLYVLIDNVSVSDTALSELHAIVGLDGFDDSV